MVYLVDSFLDVRLKNVGAEPKITYNSLPWIFQPLVTKLCAFDYSFSLYTFLVISSNKFYIIYTSSFKKNLKCLLKASGQIP